MFARTGCAVVTWEATHGVFGIDAAWIGLVQVEIVKVVWLYYRRDFSVPVLIRSWALMIG